jgi:hypothetical protein
MIRLVALALLFGGVAVAQEDLARKIDEIVPRLSDDAIEARDQAVRALVDLGPAALPLLRKRASELTAETRGRLLEACTRIESRNTLLRYLPPLRRVTLDWDNRPAREALDEIGRRIELNVDGSNASADGAITFSLKEATPIQALDEVCRLAGLNWRSVDDELNLGRRRGAAAPRGEPRLMVQNGKTADFPTAYLRHYRFRVTQVSLTRTNNFQNAGQSVAQMNLDLCWAPDVKPDGLHSFKITELKDDQGRSLIAEENDRFRGRMRSRGGRYRGRDMSSYGQYLTFKYPESDARKIALLKGTAVFSFPQEVKTIGFEKPTESVGKSIELHGLTVTLKEYQEKESGHSLTLEITGKYQGPREGEPGEEDDFNNLPFSYEDIELLTEAGETLRHQGMSGRGDGKSYTWQMDFSCEKPSAAKEIRIFCVLSRFNDETAFEIRDIPLPK